jgi:methionyl-tRNA formyltransferase
MYISFWNGVFAAKEWLIWHLPFLGSLFRRFFSLKLWARNHNVEIVFSSDFNSQDFMNFVSQHQPDVIFTRINQILREPILLSAPHGCWCFHSSELPRYQGIAAEFHSLLNGEKTVGFTVMKMEPELDAGPTIGQGNTLIPKGITLHRLIEHNYTNAHKVTRKVLDDFLADTIKYSSQDSSLKSYYSWPNSNQTQAFRRKGFRFISIRDCLSYILR